MQNEIDSSSARGGCAALHEAAGRNCRNAPMAAAPRRRLAAVATHLTRCRVATCAVPAANSLPAQQQQQQQQQLVEYEALVGVPSRSFEAREAFEARRQRVYAAFADTTACAYHIAEQRGGRRIICA